MLKDSNFLCEIGTEEIPAGYFPAAIESIKKILRQKLEESRIDFADIEVYATPRRIAFMASGMAESQRSEQVEVRGPSVKAAYDAGGQPTKALDGFLKGNSITMADVFTKDSEKGAYIYAAKKLESGKTEKIIPVIIKHIIENLKFPKQMKWSDKKVYFPRPISYFLLLFNDRLVDFEMDGINSSDKTRGHYIQHDGMFEVTRISDYEKVLLNNGVIINHHERKELIRKELISAAVKAGGVLNEDEALLDIVTFLVEYPYIAVCEFNRDFLEIPDVVLIAEMKEHQKYFSVLDKNGKLTSRFLVTSNNPVNDNVRVGNVRVITARFNDAGFFYREDRKLKLHERVESLKNVMFHKELGTIHDKVERMGFIARFISDRLTIEEKEKDNIERAVHLSKADLNTAMVFEFPSLQGKIGRIYAQLDGENSQVSDAIEEHYRPRSQEDPLPDSRVSIVVSLAEKFDNLFGSYSVGNIPRGSQDPYALRRQAGAVIEMLIRNDINLNIKEVLEHVSVNYKNGKSHVDNLIDFFDARVKTYFTECGFKYDEIDACLSVGNTDYLEQFRRAKSLNEFRKNDKFSEMLLGFKRMNNIVSGFRKENSDYNLMFDQSLLVEKEEKELHAFFHERKGKIGDLIKTSSYIELFKLLIDGKNIIDGFFDKVLVMDSNQKIRDNRLYLLENILSNFVNLLDFSRISDK